jgi:hypothetical protein
VESIHQELFPSCACLNHIALIIFYHEAPTSFPLCRYQRTIWIYL